MKIYLVSWTGGHDIPQYAAFKSPALAFATAREWLEDMDEGDQIDVLEINLYDYSIRRIEAQEIAV